MATTPDASGHGYTGTLAGSPNPFQVTSPWSGFGNAMEFAGTGNCGVNCGPWGGAGMPAPSGAGGAAVFTIEAKLKMLGSGFGSVCGGFSASDQPPQLYCGASGAGDVNIYWTDDGGAQHNIAGGDLSDLAPHDVAACYDGTTMMLFLDGVLIGSQVTTGIQAPASGDNFWIGSDDLSEDIFAIIDEVRLSVGISRYTAAGYAPSPVPSVTDAHTAVLYHLDTGASPPPPPPPPPPPILNAIAKSTESDPIDWSFDTSPFDTTSPFAEVVGFAFKSGVIVAIGTGGPTLVATSTDGVNWTTQATPFDGVAAPTCICYGGQFPNTPKFVVGLSGGPSALMSSADGVTWVAEFTPIDESITGMPPRVSGLDRGNTKISVFSSADGDAWVPHQSEMQLSFGAGHQPGNIAWNPTWQIWLVSTWADPGGGTSGAGVFISLDSSVWIPKHSGADAGNGSICHGLCVAESIGAGSFVGTFTTQVIGGISTSVAAVCRSTDGFIGSSTTIPIVDFTRSHFTQFQAIEAMCATNTHVIAVGSGWYWSANSPDGLAWSLGGVPGGVGSGDGHAYGVATNGSRVVAVGEFQDNTGAFGPIGEVYNIATSEDNGGTWTYRDCPLGPVHFPGLGVTTPKAIAWSGTVFIVGHPFGIMKSYDGITWTSMATPIGMQLQPSGVCFGVAANKWVMVGTGNILTATGSDPTSWVISTGAPGYPYTTFWDDTQLLAVAWSPDRAEFLAVGDVFSADTIVMGDSNGNLHTSVDGMATWRSNFRFNTHSPAVVKFLSSGDETNRWVAGGQSDGVNPMTAVSPDGWSWTPHASPWDTVEGARINAFAWNGIELVATGHAGIKTAMAIDFRDSMLPDLHLAPGGWVILDTPFDGDNQSELFDIAFHGFFLAAGTNSARLPTLALYDGVLSWTPIGETTLKTGIGKVVIALFGFPVGWLAGGIWKPTMSAPLRIRQRGDNQLGGAPRVNRVTASQNIINTRVGVRQSTYL